MTTMDNKCPICGREFPGLEHVCRHVYFDHLNEVTIAFQEDHKIRCEICWCGTTFNAPWFFYTHVLASGGLRHHFFDHLLPT